MENKVIKALLVENESHFNKKKLKLKSNVRTKKKIVHILTDQMKYLNKEFPWAEQ